MPSSTTRPISVSAVKRPASPPRNKDRVAFPSVLVTGVSRPINAAESTAIAQFESHARSCRHCENPYEVHRAHKQLCSAGHRLAQEVASYLYVKSEAPGVYSMHPDPDADANADPLRPVRVELPAGYENTRGLMRAIDRSTRHRRHAPFVSMDRTYYVAARVPSTRHRRSSSSTSAYSYPVKVEQPQHPPATLRREKSKRPQTGEIVDWPSTPYAYSSSPEDAPRPVQLPPQLPPREGRLPAPAPTSATVIIEPTSSRHGSLYAADMEQQRRDRQRRYNVEIREPPRRDTREGRTSGYFR